MNHYDCIIAGAGASGLTAATLLAKQNNKVLLLEKSPRIGGSLARFRKNDMPFDIGFHFTGGLNADGRGMMDEMLKIMGMRHFIEPVRMPPERSHRIAFEQSGEIFDLPDGLAQRQEYFKKQFPAEAEGIDIYFKRFAKVSQKTVTMINLSPPSTQKMEHLPEEWITLQQVLDELIKDPTLKALLSAVSMCYGSKPSEVSFANHCRMGFGLYDSTAKVKNGGEAFVQAFSQTLAQLQVDIQCRTEISEFNDIKDRQVRRFRLSDGSEVTASACILTMHPHAILQLLPEKHTTRAFRNRIMEFEASAGFFAMFGHLQNNCRSQKLEENHIFSIFPDSDVNRMLSPEVTGDLPMVIFVNQESAGEKNVNTVTGLEISFNEHVKKWRNSKTGHRDQAYLDYKHQQVQKMLRRWHRFQPDIQSDFNFATSASMLTFRDYLNTPYGAAYGIRQKIGQFNLLGKLPLHNLYAAGQSSLLPGVMGAMASGFFAARAVVGKNNFQKFINSKLCN